ncbi:MAG TPA: shikimate dehydrogenase [Pirellulales bacterium]|jgi:3-dehydroquinate dehydratase/shikimate dehydrogenase|nr:shikimate dehydrogenase [Pirellulales bacterium]
MLCVVLACPTAEELLREHHRFVAAGAKLVEWRLDHLRQPFDVAALLSQRPGPVIVTVRLPADGGRWTGTEADREQLLRASIAAGVEYVDLEESTAARIARTGETKRIVSLHDFSGTPDDLPVMHARLARHDADVVKLAALAASTHDAFRMLELLRDSRVATVGLCMGELGTPTRVLAARFGAPWTYAAADGSEPPAPGQLGFVEMRDLYRAESIDANTAMYGVIGDPVGHSRSPAIHNAALASCSMNGVYLPFRVPSGELLTFVDDAISLGIRGLSVTIPHKEGVLARVTHPDEAVREIGAANTLVFGGDVVHGYNTDRSAAIESLAVALDKPTTTPKFDGLTALVLGAGGAAKAIVHGLKRCGARVVIAARTRERAEELARPWQCETVAWHQRHKVSADVLVNCTPLGMSPKIDDTPFDANHLRSTMVVFDTVYNPEQTRLLREAAAVGCMTTSGVEMFIRQAAKQFELFTGQPAPLDVMRAALASTSLQPAGPSPLSIVLIGYRGTGKSVVAEHLAERLGWQAIDADAEVERRAGKSIAAIFATSGEQAFRNLESEVIAELVDRQRVVIAAGGGVVLCEENRRALARAGRVVWLRASVATILQRVAADPTTAARRPNLSVAGGDAEVRTLLAVREPLYRQCSRLVLDTDDKTPEQVAAESVALLGLAPSP